MIPSQIPLQVGLQQQHLTPQLDQLIGGVNNWACLPVPIDKRTAISISFPFPLCTAVFGGISLLNEGFSTGAISAFGAGAGGTLACAAVYGAQTLYMANKTKQLAKLKFESKYEKNGQIEPEDIITLMKVPNKVLHKELIKEMNFKQLYFARQALPEREFQSLLTSGDLESRINTEALNLWRSILNDVPKIRLLGELKQKLKEKATRAVIKKDPLVGTAICEVWKTAHGKDVESIITSSQIFLFLNRKAASKEEVTLEVEGHAPIQVNRSLLVQNSRFFSDMLSGKMAESQRKTIPFKLMEEVDDFETFKLYIKILNYEVVPLDPLLIQKLIKYANVYQSAQLLTSLDIYMATHAHLFSRDDLLELAMENPELKHIRDFFENERLNHKLIDGNWEETIGEANQCQFLKLEKKCKDFAQQRLIDFVDAVPLDSKQLEVWFERCKRVLSGDEYNQLLESLKTHLRIENFVIIYSKATDEKHSLEEACEQFCKDNAEQFKIKGLWSFLQVPKKLALLIYKEEGEDILIKGKEEESEEESSASNSDVESKVEESTKEESLLTKKEKLGKEEESAGEDV